MNRYTFGVLEWQPDSSITKYLVDLPGLFRPVTVNHLIHHISGIRDGFVLTALSKKLEADYTNENVIKYLKIQKHFNFEPGSRYEYNNSGYVLLATIIEQVTGQRYGEYLKQNFFDPLGMSQTYVSGRFPDHRNIAEGYHEGGPYRYQPGHFQGNTYGSTGIITNLNDLFRWEKFLQFPHTYSALAPVVHLLLKPGSLNNGAIISYAGGLEKFVYKNLTVYEHFGSDEGFKAEIVYFSSRQLSVIGLTNNGSYYDLQRLLFQISDFVIGNTAQKEALHAPIPALDSLSYFYNKAAPAFLKVAYDKTVLKISSTPGGYGIPHILLDDTLVSTDPIPVKYVLRQKKTIQKLDSYYHHNDQFVRIIPPGKNADFDSFGGEYYSEEVATTYKIIRTDAGLQFEFFPGMVFDLFAINKTDFIFDFQGANFLEFTKDGFNFSREGCRRLSFVKQR